MIFPPQFPQNMLIYALLLSKSRESHTHFCRRIHKCARIGGGVELNPGNASISLLLVKMSRVAFLLTFVVVCQDWKVEGAGGGVGGPQTAQVYGEWGCRC